MNKKIVVPKQPEVVEQSYMTWSAWSRRYVTVRRIYALVG